MSELFCLPFTRHYQPAKVIMNICVQGWTIRPFPGCVYLGFRNCVLLPIIGKIGKQNATFLLNFTQPAESLIVQPCSNCFSASQLPVQLRNWKSVPAVGRKMDFLTLIAILTLLRVVGNSSHWSKSCLYMYILSLLLLWLLCPPRITKLSSWSTVEAAHTRPLGRLLPEKQKG